MNKNNPESENYLGNIADELGTISGTCTEIKEAQLNAATVEDVERVGNDVKTVIDASIKNLDKIISEPWSILNDMRNSMDCNIISNRQVVEESEEHLSEKLDKLDTKLSNKLDTFTAKPPVREVVHHIAKETWQWYTLLGFAIATVALCVAVFFWQEGRIEQCRTSDIKYHFIQMCGGVSSDGLDKIEELFQDPEKVKRIEKMVRDHEKRVEETARALQQKHRLEEKLNELNAEDSMQP